MAIEIVDFPIKHGDFPLQNVSSPEGTFNHQPAQKKTKDLIGSGPPLKSHWDHRSFSRLSSTGTKAESFKCDSCAVDVLDLGIFVGYRGIKSPEKSRKIQGVCETKISVLHPQKIHAIP